MTIRNYYWRIHYKYQRLHSLIYDIILLFIPNKIFINAWINRVGTQFNKKNWGDDINVLFFEEITNNKIIVKNDSVLYKYTKKRSFSCIGSIIGMVTNSQTEVWGSGLISSNTLVKEKPRKIHSVRGPLTREILLNQGIPCPPIYGDPALLLSKYYSPKTNKKYDLGIIAHYVDEDNDILQKFCDSHTNVLLISMSKYVDWHEIPDKITSCKKVISSSLHGLIVSDSYAIPNIWVEFSSLVIGNGFKFRDYFASVGRKEKEPMIISNKNDLEQLLNKNDFPIARSINFQAIYDSCPFKSQLPSFE